MTLWETLRSLVRHWYIFLAAIVVAAVAGQAVLGAGGVYWSRVEVTFLVPTSADNPNSLRPTSSDLIMTAGVVAKMVNGSTVRNKMADPAATLVGEGVVDGWSVRLPDYGGQWSILYPRQVLDVQVSGPTREAVRDRHFALLARIDEALSTLQEAVPPGDRIMTLAVPEEPSIRHVSGQPLRSLAMVCLLSVAAALTASSLVESRRRRRNTAGRA